MIAKEGRVILIPLLLITFPVGLYAHSTDNQAMIILYAVLGVLFLFCLNFCYGMEFISFNHNVSTY